MNSENNQSLQKILLYALIACVFALTGFIIGEVWFNLLEQENTLKIFMSIGILAVMICSALIANLENGSKLRVYILLPYVILACILSLEQIWFSAIAHDIYLKALVTLAILFGITGAIIVMRVDFSSNKDLKDKNFLE